MQTKFQMQIAEVTGKIAQNHGTEKRLMEEIALLKKEVSRLKGEENVQFAQSVAHR